MTALPKCINIFHGVPKDDVIKKGGGGLKMSLKVMTKYLDDP